MLSGKITWNLDQSNPISISKLRRSAVLKETFHIQKNEACVSVDDQQV